MGYVSFREGKQNTWWWDARHVSVLFVPQNLDNLIRTPTLISHIVLQMAFWVVATHIFLEYSSLFGEDSHFDDHIFQRGLKQPTSLKSSI